MHHSNKKMNPLFICDVKSVIVISDARHYVERVVFHALNCDVLCDVYRDVRCDDGCDVFRDFRCDVYCDVDRIRSVQQ